MARRWCRRKGPTSRRCSSPPSDAGPDPGLRTPGPRSSLRPGRRRGGAVLAGHTAGLIDQLWAMMEKQDWDVAIDFYAEDAVEEWPQSGERIRGRDNIMAINKNYPGFPKL